ncbi:MAG: NADPH-dependent FMN reductase [Planctomycetota bacterium]|jgi:NAD(P)H-dependent FMN reductase
MSTPPRILAIAGSLRRESWNRKVLRHAARGARDAGAEVTELDLGDYRLPVYDGDLEAAEGLPENALRLKDVFLAHEGLLLACPEYNSSITAALKNAIDWVSRPREGEPPLACFAGRVAALMAASPGGLGGLRGLVTVRAILGSIRVIVLPEQVAVPAVHEALDEDGAFRDEALRERVEGLGAGLARTVARLHAPDA